VGIEYWRSLAGTPVQIPPRTDLSIFPFYWEVVGNVRTVVTKLEDEITEKYRLPVPRSYKTKGRERYPFLYIRNPPRHGKSLAMNLLFRGSDEVLVVSITYNSGMGISDLELHDDISAKKAFWTRVMMALVGDKAKSPLGWYLSNYPLSDWSEVLQVFPSLEDKNIVICADEISKLTSKFPNKGALGNFWDSIFQFHTFTESHFRRTVFTGFDHSPDTSIASSSYVVITDPFVIKIATPRETRRLGQHLLWTYAKAGVVFPTFLFDLIKSSPGLLGTWASLTFGNTSEIQIRTLKDFCTNNSISTWCKELTDTNFERRLNLIELAFFNKLRDNDIKDSIDLAIGMTSTVNGNPTFQLVPFVVVLIIVTLFGNARYVESFQNAERMKLFEALREIIDISRTLCNAEPSNCQQTVLEKFDSDEWPLFVQKSSELKGQRNPSSDAAGSCFEAFCLHALRLTSLVSTKDNKQARVGSVFRSEKVFCTREENIPVFIVNERNGLAEMLTPFCYSLFPIRTDELADIGGLVNRRKALLLDEEPYIETTFKNWCLLKQAASSASGES
jgi:hypothetical protein